MTNRLSVRLPVPCKMVITVKHLILPSVKRLVREYPPQPPMPFLFMSRLLMGYLSWVGERERGWREKGREQGSKGAREQIRVRRGKREWSRRKRSRGIERCEED